MVFYRKLKHSYFPDFHWWRYEKAVYQMSGMYVRVLKTFYRHFLVAYFCKNKAASRVLVVVSEDDSVKFSKEINKQLLD